MNIKAISIKFKDLNIKIEEKHLESVQPHEHFILS